ncbi:carbamoyl-phosphate synthase [Laccaria bicolor S238N-H82]|uniref:Carbamoyl-phosphate synthase n=1 Tax=Laccaria bicolor (strain S238N-H82 / ATCC MYA-4686) TaxID=486041 RepID=B0E2D8_LACBS|nr:carbamoyl-phosphate synthase [Laccaria bicolor S238N-H82]EDQ98997.1 carbamoyl-phosphate synthase [Laccaria bicolor S238N-H82]|eukprot:XP_001890358.1 carbamoyl-phosphate synthase [Laccaria bicolor S238N-H82]
MRHEDFQNQRVNAAGRGRDSGQRTDTLRTAGVLRLRARIGSCHFLAESSLGAWLKESGVPALFGVDTRALTKRIREKGSLLGKALVRAEGTNPNDQNLVAAVSIAAPKLYKARLHPPSRPLRVLAIDVGMKHNQIRCFAKRGIELKVVPCPPYALLPLPRPIHSPPTPTTEGHNKPW